MANKKDELDNVHLTNLSNSLSCWWSDEVVSPDNGSNVPFRDFVLISEFSELEGPLPLAVVSNSGYIDLKHYTDKLSANTTEYKLLERELKKIGLQSFDFNAFVLRVVSVDRSTEFEQIDEIIEEQTPMTPSLLFEEIPKPYLFSIPDDTQVYFTDSGNNFFAFTHHLTLFDINARGYVHPVALSYITRDPNKIVIRFEELMEKFNGVSIRLKKGNYSNFILDLKCRLLDLEYTQSNLNSSVNTDAYTPTCTDNQPDGQKPALSIQAIQQAITATKLMIDTLESTSQMHIISNDTPPTKKRSSADPPKDYQPKYIDTLYPVAHFERKLRSLAQLCQEPEEEEPFLNNNSNSKKRPSFSRKPATVMPLVFSMIESQQDTPAMSNSSSTATTTPLSVVQSRPTLANTIAHDMYSEAINDLQNMTFYFGKSSVVLDVEEEDQSFVEPMTSALCIGRTFMLNVDNPQPRENVPNSPTEEDAEVEKEKSNYANPVTPMNNIFFESFESKSLDEEQLKHIQNTIYPLLFSPSQLWKSKDQPKIYLLEVLRCYQSLIVDVIFSLLTGRTVLIQGSADNKSRVQKVVNALSVFVPGQNRFRHQIIDWFEEARLTDAQIKSIKLVGIDKNNMDPSIHIDGSCVLDIDIKNGSLNSSPVYVEGQWINQLLDRMMLFSSDESYLAYLHTVFMTISLKAFLYHHLYISDEFKLDESPPTSVNKGYSSETNSESGSMISRKWSIRLMSYLKKQEEIDVPKSTTDVCQHTEDEDYSEENQATVTLQTLLNKPQEDKPRTVVGLFSPLEERTKEGQTSHPKPQNDQATANTIFDRDIQYGSISTAFSSRRGSVSSSSSNDDALSRDTYDKSELNFEPDDLLDFGAQSGDSSEDEDYKPVRPRKGKHRYRDPSDVGPDGVSYIEREGRRYLQEKLKVYGDDQTIVVYLATCVL